MKSIIQSNKVCWECCYTLNLEEHHIFFGTANRKLSEKYGLKVWLCHEHHTGNKGVHRGNKDLDNRLKQLAQNKFEETHTRQEFMNIFERNYI